MKKLILYILILAVVVPATSCRKAAERARENIRVEAVEKFELRGVSGADVTLRVVNDTGYRLSLETAQADVYYGQSFVGSIVLCERLEVARKTTCSLPASLKFNVSNPLTLYVMVQKIAKEDISQVYVSYAAEGRGGPAPVNISRGRVPLSEILNTFGLDIEDVKNYIK